MVGAFRVEQVGLLDAMRYQASGCVTGDYMMRLRTVLQILPRLRARKHTGRCAAMQSPAAWLPSGLNAEKPSAVMYIDNCAVFGLCVAAIPHIVPLLSVCHYLQF